MLIFTLKKQWYEKIKSGEKTIEYREVKPYWKQRLSNTFGYYKGTYLPSHNPFEKGFGVCIEAGVCPVLCPCILRLGYTNRYMTADITKIEIVDGKDTDLHIDKPVYAIHLTGVREEK